MDTVSGIGVLDKTVMILRAVAEGPITLRQLVAATDMSRATAHRLAQGMETLGLLRRTDDGAFALGLTLIGLGRSAADAFPVSAAALPVLRDLQVETGESVQLFVPDGGDRLCVAAVDSAHELRTTVPVGARYPMALGSAGTVLSGVEEAVDGRWVASVAERAPGVASVSAPVWDGASVLAAVSISGPIERVTQDPGARYGDAVVAAARRVEAALRTGR